MHRMERCSLDMCFAVNTDVVKQQIQALGMQCSEVAGCDSTCSNLQSIFCRSLSVYFYCYFTSHDKEVEDPLLCKLQWPKEEFPFLIPLFHIHQEDSSVCIVTGFAFFVVSSVLTVEEMCFILPQRSDTQKNLSSALMSCDTLLKYCFIIAFRQKGKY